MTSLNVRRDVPLRPWVSLRAGGNAEHLTVAHDAHDLADACALAEQRKLKLTVLGSGSNVLPSEDGVPGLTVLNQASRIEIDPEGEVLAESGCSFQELLIKAAQQGRRGLEFAVGIPGTLGGALVSNAGAYRSCVSEFLVEIEIADGKSVRWVDPSWMEFSYRDSRLRRPNPPAVIMTRVRMQLPAGDPLAIYDEAREYQRQRISKQPPSPSAGSFFKNVTDPKLAADLPGLSDGMRKAGVVPAGFLIEAAGLKGHRLGGATMGVRHANFILNVGNASASDIRALAEEVAERVFDRFGIRLEEEVMYLGDWSHWHSS